MRPGIRVESLHFEFALRKQRQICIPKASTCVKRTIQARRESTPIYFNQIAKKFM